MPPKKKHNPTASQAYYNQYRDRQQQIRNNMLAAQQAQEAAYNAAANGGGSPAAAPAGPSQRQVSAYETINSILSGAGLGSLSGQLWEMILAGNDNEDHLLLQLQNTNEWRTRFAGNEALRQRGLAVLTPSEYLNMERSYAQIMRNYGLPAGFYDEPSDFANWIGNNVSAAELQQRVSMHADLVNRTTSQETQAQLQSMGWTSGDLLAASLDPGRAMPLLQQQWETIKLGARARAAGYVADNAYLSQLASRGVTEEQASQGFGLIAGSLADARRLGLTAEDLQSEVFDNNADAAGKRKRLASAERARFSGSSGVAAGSLSQNSSGAY